MNIIAAFLVLVPLVSEGANTAEANDWPNAERQTVRAASIAELRFPLPPNAVVRGVRVATHGNGSEIKSIDLVPRGGTPLFANLLVDEKPVLVVPMVAVFDWESSEFVFPVPAEYEFTVFVELEAGGRASFQSVVVAGDRDANDRGFLEALADVASFRELVGQDLLEELPSSVSDKLLDPADYTARSTLLVGEILKGVGYAEPGTIVRDRGTMEDALRWADRLSTLAEKWRESSYAPYASYYAGCCYLTALMVANKSATGEVSAASSAANPLAGKARSCFEFAAAGDSFFLKSRARYMTAFLCGVTADWSKALEEIQHLSTEASMDPELRRRTAELADSLQREQQKAAKTDSRGKPVGRE